MIGLYHDVGVRQDTETGIYFAGLCVCECAVMFAIEPVCVRLLVKSGSYRSPGQLISRLNNSINLKIDNRNKQNV